MGGVKSFIKFLVFIYFMTEKPYKNYIKKLIDYIQDDIEYFEKYLFDINHNKNNIVYNKMIAYNFDIEKTDENKLESIVFKHWAHIKDFNCEIRITEDSIEYSIRDNFDYFDIDRAKAMGSFLTNLENTLTKDLKEICEYYSII
jgi:hypothetical protein